MNDITETRKNVVLKQIKAAVVADNNFRSTNYASCELSDRCKSIIYFLGREAKAALKLNLLTWNVQSTYALPELVVAGDIDGVVDSVWNDALASVDAEAALIAEEKAIASKKYAEMEARKIKEGRRVRVVRGKKVPIGTVGTVAVVGCDAYKTIVIVDENNRRHYTYEKNLEVIIS